MPEENEVETEPQVGSRISVIDDDKEFLGEVVNITKKGRYHVNFDDGDTGDYAIHELTLVVPEEADESPIETAETSPPPTAEPPTTEQPPVEPLAEPPIEAKKVAEPTEAELLGIPKSKVKTKAYKGKKGVTETMVEKEEKRHEALVAQRLKNRVEKKKALAKEKPIDARRKLLTARLTKYHAKKQATNYRKEQIKAWTDELMIIKTSPAGWKPGCVKAEKRSLDDKVAAALRQKN